MELPPGIYQGWSGNNQNLDGSGRFAPYNNFELTTYNNLGFSTPSTSNSREHQFHLNNCSLDYNGNAHHKYTVATSPTTKKSVQQKLATPLKQRSHLVSIKSKLGVEYRRYALTRDDILRFADFYQKIDSMHHLQGISEFNIYYTDQDGELLPINNDDNLAKAINATPCIKSTQYIVASNNNNTHINNTFKSNSYHGQPPQMQQVIVERPFLKLRLERKGMPNSIYSIKELKCKRKENFIHMLIPSANSSDSRLRISMPEDFRQVSSIIDADILPAERRRVVLKRGGSDKPLGFYIRDGTYPKMNSDGQIEKHYGIFISRLVPGGLAESTNLLAENDEILEVNGVEVGKGKRLDQVRDMMIANSSNLIITTCPAKPCNPHSANRIRQRNHCSNMIGRDRLPSTQSTSSELGEDFIRHHMH